jgi:transposase
MTKADSAAATEMTAEERLPMLEAENAKLHDLVKALKHNVEVYRRLAFGPSSEKRGGSEADLTAPAEQGHLFYAQLIAEARETAERNGIDASIEASPPKKPRKPKGRRGKFPEHILTVTTKYDLPEDQRVCACGSPLHEMGAEIARELERLEMSFVHIYQRMKYACRSCEAGVTTTPGPDRAFPKGILGTGFLSYLINERFGNHMPYYRIEKKHAKEGVDVSRSVMQRSVARCAEKLRPLYDLLCSKVRAADILFTDDTPITIARPNDRSNGSKKGHVWIYLDRDGHHAYDFTDSWKMEGPCNWLATFEGYAHCDKYKGYDPIFQREGVVRVGCLAHVRRKFIDAEKSDPDVAAEILARIRRIYAIETRARESGLTADEIKALREEHAAPLLQELRARLFVLEASALPKSPTGKAVAYALNQWDDLLVYLTDGRLEIDNNAAERAMRPLGVGRKNWLFFLNDNGAEAAMVHLSLLRTAEAVGVNGVDYFRDVLTRIDREPDLEKLLPLGWKEHFFEAVEDRRSAALGILASN